MRDVSAKATRPLLDLLENEIDLDALVAGLPVTLAELRDTRNRIDWDAFTDLLARVGEMCGPLEEIGARIIKEPSFELLWRGGQLFFSAKQLYDLGVRYVAPAFFPVAVTAKWLPSGRPIFELEILPGYRESIHFVRISHRERRGDAEGARSPRVEGRGAVVRRATRAPGPAPPTLPYARVAREKERTRARRPGRRAPRIESHENELRESRAALATSRHEMRELIERLPDGVLIHRAGIVRWVNAAMVQLLGEKRREDVIGKSVTELVPPEDREALARAVERAMRGENGPHPEYTVLRPDGTLRRLQSGVTQAVELDGEKVRMVVLRDITDERRMREQAAIADRLASLGALAAGVGHEINNPLAYVRLSLETAVGGRRARQGSRAARRSATRSPARSRGPTACSRSCAT